MYKKKVLFSFFAMVLFAFSGVSVFAQTSEEKNDQDVQNLKTVTVATTNIEKAEIAKQEGSALEVTYAVSNRVGVQTDIRAILILQQNNKDVYEQASSEIFSLGEGVKLVKTIQMDVPDFLKGEYTVILRLATESGLALAVVPLEKKIVLSGSGEFIEVGSCVLTVEGDKDKREYSSMEGVDVASNEVLTARCSAKNFSSKVQSGTPRISEYRRSTSGKKMNEYQIDSVSFAPNEKKDFTFTVVKNSEPQAYTQTVTFVGGDGKTVSNITPFHYVLQGEGATIQNIVFDKSVYNKGDIAKVSFFWSGSADNFVGSRNGGTGLEGRVTLQLQNGEGASCASEKKLASADVVSIREETFAVEENCSNPSISAIVRNNDGKVLDSRTVFANEFKSESKKNTSPVQALIGGEKESGKIKYFTFVGIGVLISLFCLLIVLIKKLRTKSRKINMFFFIFFTLCFFGMGGAFPDSVKADTVAAMPDPDWGWYVTGYKDCSAEAYCSQRVCHQEMDWNTGVYYEVCNDEVCSPFPPNWPSCSCQNYSKCTPVYAQKNNNFIGSIVYTVNAPGEIAPGAAVPISGVLNYGICNNAAYTLYFELSKGGVNDSKIVLHNFDNYHNGGFQGAFDQGFSSSVTAPSQIGPHKLYFYGRAYSWYRHTYGIEGQVRASFSVPYTVTNPHICTGTPPDPASTELCLGSNQGLLVDTSITLVSTCNPLKKCEYTCKSGYAYKNGLCLPKPTADLRINGSKNATVLLDADVRFEWNTNKATNKCTMQGPTFTPSNVLTSSPITKPAAVGMTSSYTLTCINDQLPEIPATNTASLTVKCTPTTGSWSACTPECRNDNIGTRTLSGGVDEFCTPKVGVTENCYVPKCQPGGFEEVKP